jgi:hypothetical protein
MLAFIGGQWEVLRALGVVLWPIRFILLITVAMIGVLLLPQAKDALYGAVIEGDGRWWVFAAVIAWAVQTWYWARFLLDLPLRRLPQRRYGTTPFDADFVAPLITWIPRSLGASVFVMVSLFIWGTSCASVCPDEGRWTAPLWTAVYLLCGIVFLALTKARRDWLLRQGVTALPPIRPLPPVPARIIRLLQIAMIIWLGLLLVAAASALIDFSYKVHLLGRAREVREIVALGIVAVLGIGSIIVLWYLRLAVSTTGFVLFLVAANSGLFLTSILDAASFGMLAGPAMVLMLSAGIWVGATSFFLAYPGERLRVPVTTLLLAATLVFGFVPRFVPPIFGYHAGNFDNHRVRTLTEMSGTFEADERANLMDAFEAWRTQASCVRHQGDDTCRKPMILVAAQGGASRSGYWVATLLGALDDAIPDFHKQVFAISGVSGGSLGAAVYQRLLARKHSGRTHSCVAAGGPSDSFSVCGQAVLEHDFLGPAFFSMFNADMLQRLLPGDLMPDRAEALESAWELAWRRAIGAADAVDSSARSNDFADPLQLRTKDQVKLERARPWLPVLILNGASVKTGRRIVTSDVAFEPKCKSSDLLYEGADLPSAVDFYCLTRRQVRLSTAVHNSARFPYISPAGTLWANDGAGHTWQADRIVDGGYVEAQGATTLTDLLEAIAAGWQRNGKNGRWDDDLLPIVISIQNDPPQGERDCAKAADDVRCRADKLVQALGNEASTMSFAMQIANDLLAPPIGLASSRTGRGAYAARSLAVRMYYEGLGRRPDGRTDGWSAYRFNLRESQGPAPAMSWYLSKRSRRDMAADLCPTDDGPEAELDNGLKKLGDELGIKDLPGRIRHGPGCDALKRPSSR